MAPHVGLCRGSFAAVMPRVRLSKSMLRGHLIEFLGEIEPHKQSSWLKARPLADDNRSTWTFNIDRFCAGPNAIGLALKSVQEFQFGHHKPRASSYLEEPTARINRRGRLDNCWSGS